VERRPLELGDLVEHWTLVGDECSLVTAKNAEEWERLVWRPERLGFSVAERQRVAPLDFAVIAQPWLHEKVMRYARLRLARTSG